MPDESRWRLVQESIPAVAWTEEVQRVALQIQVGICELTLLHRIGLLSPHRAVEVLSERLRSGSALSPEEEHLALALRRDLIEIEDILERDCAENVDQAVVERKVMLLILVMLRGRWATTGDPNLELATFLTNWKAVESFEDVIDGGMCWDRLWWGQGARRRFLGRFDKALTGEIERDEPSTGFVG